MKMNRKLTLDLKDQDTWDMIYFLEFMDKKRCSKAAKLEKKP